MISFNSDACFPNQLLAQVIDKRVTDPEFAHKTAKARVRRAKLAPGGKLNLLAADHPARLVTTAGQQKMAMANRRDYLGRILRVLASPRVDGIMATMDILEELLIIDGILQAAGSASLLNDRVLIASLNRGGLAGSVWELDDPMTGATPESCEAYSLDGVKTLLRVDLSNQSSLKTMVACAQAINACNAAKLPTFLEPLPVTKTEGGYRVSKDPEALARLVGVASALGDSSRYLWLKLPYCENYDSVARSTTLPILLLGGESVGGSTQFLGEIHQALRAGPNLRGTLIGRNILYPREGDPLTIAEAVGGIVHDGWTVEQALAVEMNTELTRV